MTTSRPIRAAASGKTRSSSAMLVSGPTAATVTGSGEVMQQLGERDDGRARVGRRPGTAAAPPRRGRRCRARGRPAPAGRARGTRRGAGGDGHVRAAGQVQHPQRVLRRLRQLDVAVHGGDQAQVDLRAGEGQQDGQRVVDAGVGVDHQGDGMWAPAGILAAAPGPARRRARHAAVPPGPGMTDPGPAPFPRSECTSCRQVPGLEEWVTEPFGNGFTTVRSRALQRMSRTAENGRPRCLPFSLSAAPSPAADTTSEEAT